MNKGQFPQSNKTISGIDLPKIDQDDDAAGVKSDGILSNISDSKVIEDKTSRGLALATA